MERQKHKQIWNCDRSNYVGKGSWTTAQGGVNKCWIDFGECFSRLFISVTELWILNKRNESSNNMARVILPCQLDGKPRWNRILFALFEINGFCLSGIRWTLTRTSKCARHAGKMVSMIYVLILQGKAIYINTNGTKSDAEPCKNLGVSQDHTAYIRGAEPQAFSITSEKPKS